MGLDAAHSDICRFTGERDDSVYQLVEGHIQELASKARNRRAQDRIAYVSDQGNEGDKLLPVSKAHIADRKRQIARKVLHGALQPKPLFRWRRIYFEFFNGHIFT